MRTGKIARLPHLVREELDQRLANGARTDALLAWLNGLPEAQTVLREQFGGRSVNHREVGGGGPDAKAADAGGVARVSGTAAAGARLCGGGKTKAGRAGGAG